MNENEKDLIEENVSVNEEAQTIERVQPIDEQNVSMKQIEENFPLDKNAPVNNLEAETKVPLDATGEKVDEQGEKVTVKSKEEPSKDVLFGGYEVRNWDFNPRIYKIVAGAAVFNLLAIFVIGQTNMLATSACDSPFVDRVCQVLDTVSVAKRMYDGSGGESISDPNYQLPEIDEGEFVWVDMTNVEPQIQYPEDYFQIANRDEIAERKRQEELLVTQGFSNNSTTTTPYSPPFSPKLNSPPKSSSGGTSRGRSYRSSRKSRSGGNGLLAKKANPPKKIKDPIKGEANNSLFEVEGNDPDGNQTAEKKPEPTPEKNPIEKNTDNDSDSVSEINTNPLPLQIFVNDFLDKKEVNEVIIKKPFLAKYKISLNNDGTFKDNKFRPLEQKGDKEALDLINYGIKSLGASKFLKHLVNQKIKDIDLTIVQNENEFQALIVSSQSREEDARELASGLSGAITVAKILKQREINGGEKDPIKLQGEKDELYLLKNTSVTSEDKNFKLIIRLSREEYQTIVNRRLQQEAAKREKDPNYGKPDKGDGSAKTQKSENKKA